MDRFKFALASLAAAGAALVATPVPANAEPFGYAQQWIAQRFQRGARPHVPARPVVQRSFTDVRPRPRPVAAQRTAYRRPPVRRVVERVPAYERPPVARQVVYRPSVVVYEPIVQRLYVVHRPIVVRRCSLPDRDLCG
jgi:membrane-bound lytic murein transglycosylase B